MTKIQPVKKKAASKSGPATQGEDEFADIRESRKEQRLARTAEIERRSRDVELRLATRDALQLAAWGTDEQPTGSSSLPGSITIDAKTWAGWIVLAAKAWRIHPGHGALDENPLPDSGSGIEAARRIFDKALAGKSAKTIEAAIKQAREALGAYSELDPVASESEAGLLMFFRQLRRFYEGEWRPPRLRSRGGSDTSASKVGEGTVKRPLLTKQQEAVKRLIEASQRPLTGPEVVDELSKAGVPISESGLTSRVVPALKRKYGLLNKPRVGYYFPKAGG